MANTFIVSSKIIGRILLAFSLVLICSVPVLNQSSNSSEPLVITATLTTKRGLAIGLKQENFEVFVDKEPAKILYARTEDVPLSVGIVFDASGSVKAGRALVDNLQQALKSFIERSNHANEYFVVAFNKTPQLLLDWSSDSKAILGSLGGVQPTGNTAFYDACYLAIDKVQHGRNPKRVLLVISDGRDNSSRYAFTQVREALKESNVMFYSVNVTQAPGTSLALEGQGILDEFSALSGGMAYFDVDSSQLRPKDGKALLEVVATELRNQYTIAIETGMTETKVGKWHKLKLKVKSPTNLKLEARTRDGFYLNQR